MSMTEKLNEALEYIRKHYDGTPEVGIVLGTGLGGLVNEIEIEKEIAYNFIPHFPISTVESHFGKLIFGKLGGKQIAAMQGRLLKAGANLCEPMSTKAFLYHRYIYISAQGLRNV